MTNNYSSGSGSSTSSTNPMAASEERLMVTKTLTPAAKLLSLPTNVATSLKFCCYWIFLLRHSKRSPFASDRRSIAKTTNAFKCFPRNHCTSTTATTSPKNTCTTMCSPRTRHKTKCIRPQHRRSSKTCSKDIVRLYLRMVRPVQVCTPYNNIILIIKIYLIIKIVGRTKEKSLLEQTKIVAQMDENRCN